MLAGNRIRRNHIHGEHHELRDLTALNSIPPAINCAVAPKGSMVSSAILMEHWLRAEGQLLLVLMQRRQDRLNRVAQDRPRVSL